MSLNTPDPSSFTSPEDYAESLTLTRSDIVETLYKEVGLPKSDCGDLLESMIDHITKSLVEGEVVKLAGFGIFSTRLKTERPGRNPKTGQPAIVKARRVLSFKPSKKMKDRVNAQNAQT